jgi:hypothetical protein
MAALLCAEGNAGVLAMLAWQCWRAAVAAWLRLPAGCPPPPVASPTAFAVGELTAAGLLAA